MDKTVTALRFHCAVIPTVITISCQCFALPSIKCLLARLLGNCKWHTTLTSNIPRCFLNGYKHIIRPPTPQAVDEWMRLGCRAKNARVLPNNCATSIVGITRAAYVRECRVNRLEPAAIKNRTKAVSGIIKMMMMRGWIELQGRSRS